MKKITLRLLSLMAVMALLMSLAVGCGAKKKGEEAEKTTFSGGTITVQSAGGIKFEGVGVSVYKDKAKKDIVDFTRTNADGVATLSAKIKEGSIIVLSDAPAGYAVKAHYTMDKKNTIISLSVAFREEMSPITLGGAMFDFSVTDQYNTVHTLSKLLKSKKAVVLNLWYTSCVPCKMEFPYLQQAYNEYKEDIALLAINPVDNAEAIATFANENNLTFPMAVCDPAWPNQIDGISYPTTIVIDRFGTVSFIHIGGVDKVSTFKNLFAAFVADDYKQATYSDISAFETDKSTLGTKENPYEHIGSGSFSVAVEPSKTVYYTLYGANGMELSAKGSQLKLVCDDQEYTADKDATSLVIPTSPAVLQFTNTGSSKVTYKVTLTAPEGSAGNPLTLKEGDTTVKLAADNSLGMHYTYKASGEGSLTLECTGTIAYTVAITNLADNTTIKLDKDNRTCSINVHKNDQLAIVVVATEKDGKYPAAEAKLSLSLKKEDIPDGPSSGDSDGKLNTSGKLVNANNPEEFAGAAALNFVAEIKAGEIKLFHLYKVFDAILHISDASAYVIYEGKTYTPDKKGTIAIPVTCASTNVPLAVQIGNGGKSNKKYTVKCSYPEGSLMNPYDAKAGTFKAKLAANNDQGLYYQCTAEKDGILTITLKKVTPKVDCDIQVTTFDSSLVPNTSSLLSDSEDGKTLTVEVFAGDTIRITVAVLPDEKTFKYPAATIEFTLSFS